MRLQEFFDQFPRIKLADPAKQDEIFSIIEQTSMSTSALQVSFERKPDFYAFLKAQGHKALVFTFHNKDGSAHGFACLSFRKMWWQGKEICLGYASDLRTSPKLDREARLQWRKMYALVVQHCSEIEELDGCTGFVTAVWDENTLAKKALVNKNRSFDFHYELCEHYKAHSVWGRWRPLLRRSSVRAIRAEEIQQVRRALINSKSLSWNEKDLDLTLSIFEKSFSDFLVIEVGGQIRSFALPISQSHLKALVIKSWPATLAAAAKILPMMGKNKIELNKPIETLHLSLFHSLAGDESENLIQFVDYLWNENLKKLKSERFHLLNFATWGDHNIPLQKAGYLSTSIQGGLYKVLYAKDDEVSAAASRLPDNFKNLEVGFL